MPIVEIEGKLFKTDILFNPEKLSKTDINTREAVEPPTQGILLNRKDLRSDPEEIIAKEKAYKDIKEAEIANDEATRRMYYGSEPEIPQWVIDSCRKGPKTSQ